MNQQHLSLVVQPDFTGEKMKKIQNLYYISVSIGFGVPTS